MRFKWQIVEGGAEKHSGEVEGRNILDAVLALRKDSLVVAMRGAARELVMKDYANGCTMARLEWEPLPKENE